jgi:hypothetical protein
VVIVMKNGVVIVMKNGVVIVMKNGVVISGDSYEKWGGDGW